MCRWRPTPLLDRALHSDLSSHRMGRRPRAGDYARLLSLGWHNADFRASLLIATSRSSLTLRLSRVISSADCSRGCWRVRWVLSGREQKGRPSARQGFLFFPRNVWLLVLTDPLLAHLPNTV